MAEKTPKKTTRKTAPPKPSQKQSIMQQAIVFFKKITTLLTDIPVWIKARPEAVRQWVREDRKKKKYRSFRLQKRIKPEPRDIPSMKNLLKDSFAFLWRHKNIFGAMLLMHALFYFAIIRSPIQPDMASIQETAETVLGSEGSTSLEGTVATLGAVLGLTGTSQQNTALAGAAVLIVSLAYIWVIRQLHTGEAIKARDGYYQGMTGLIPVMLVLFVLSLQAVPFTIASFVYTTARSGGLFVSGVEDLMFFLVALLIGLLTFYWLTATIIAAYIATLPGMYPVKALRAAKKLVKFQRFLVFRRMISLPVVLALTYFFILLLVIRFLPDRTFLASEIMQLLLLPIIHVYLYKLYRALI